MVVADRNDDVAAEPLASSVTPMPVKTVAPSVVVQRYRFHVPPVVFRDNDIARRKPNAHRSPLEIHVPTEAARATHNIDIAA